MIEHPPRSARLPGEPAAPLPGAGGAARPARRRSRAASRQRIGKRLIVAGFVVTIAAIVLYCAASFAGALGADLGDVLLRDAVPFARGTLAVLGLGTLVWLAGSLVYLGGVMDADPAEETGPDEP